MGNRAVITANSNLNETGIYLHWNGGRASVEAFLAYCKLKGYRCPENDSYGWASLVTVITNWFGNSGISVGIDNCSRLDTDNYDNGVYVIKDWLIVERIYADRNSEQDDYDLIDFVNDIDNHQPRPLTDDERSKFSAVKQEIINARLFCRYW